MSKLTLSDVVWGAWLITFLSLEIPAALGIAPWDTLSRTAWIDERLYQLLRTILFGFLIGLAVHIRFQTGLLRTTVGGIIIAIILDVLWAA